ncbi:MAG: efflux RND transporter permease subunit, partial [Methylocella sp.]
MVLLVMAGLQFARLGQEFIPTLDEQDIAMHAIRIPSTALSQSQAMQLTIEDTLSRFPQVAYVFSKTGTADMATDPMPPNMSDLFIIFKPRVEWPDPELPKDDLRRQISGALGALAGNAYEFSQPIQMRFNELLAGVRGDIAIKVFGEEFEPMLRVANQIASILRGTEGAEDVRVEQVRGLPFLDITIDKAGIARLGLSISAVQEVIGAAIGGLEAGVVFEGDRRFPIIVRLNDEARENLEALQNLPVPLAPTPQAERAPSVLLKQVAKFELSEGPNQISRENGKRRVVVTANARGRDIGSLVAEVQEKVAGKVHLPAGYWLSWGGQFENLAAARQRLTIVVPGCFFMIFLLLYTALGSPRDALIVFSAVPLALTGGVAALWIRDMPFSVSAAVGFIALSGVAV